MFEHIFVRRSMLFAFVCGFLCCRGHVCNCTDCVQGRRKLERRRVCLVVFGSFAAVSYLVRYALGLSEVKVFTMRTHQLARVRGDFENA